MKVALIIIYNHQYIKNIDILENIYHNKFREIYHLVPFYQGNKSNVIAVYENSIYFQGYVAQGLKHFFKPDYDHYFFIADDLLLNPIINEENYCEHFMITQDFSFISDFLNLHEINNFWQHLPEAYKFCISTPGVEIKNQIPTYDEAISLFSENGLKINPLSFKQITAPQSIKTSSCIDLIHYLYYRWNLFIKKDTKYSLNYPIVGSYSDIFIINSKIIKKFCHYCGVFAAANLHVELAIPTSLVLSTNNIITEKQIKLRGEALWTEEQFKIFEQFQFNLGNLLENFPENRIYLHPIKISKWKK